MRKAEAPKSGWTILVVDDHEETLKSLRKLLEREGHEVLTADRGTKALALLEEHDVHVMLIDYFMPVMNGDLLIRAIRNRNTRVQIILQTGYSGEKPPREMMRRLAIQGYHDKCDGPERLLLWVDAALKNYDQLMLLERAGAPATGVRTEIAPRLDALVADVALVRAGGVAALPPDAASVLDAVVMNGAALAEWTAGEADASTLEPGPPPVRPVPVDVVAVLRAVASSVKARARCEVRTSTDEIVALADRRRLAVLLAHLAAREDAAARPVRLSAAERDDRAVAVTVTVGSAPGPSAAVARCLARAMGAGVAVESSQDETTFTLVLPSAGTRTATAPATVADGGAS